MSGRVSSVAILRMVIIVACFFCAGQAAVQSNQATIQEAIHAVDDKMLDALNKGDAKALAAFYTEDAYLLPPGGDLIHGRSAIETFYREHLTSATFTYTSIDITPLGDKTAREIGTTSVEQRITRTTSSGRLFGRTMAASGS